MESTTSRLKFEMPLFFTGMGIFRVWTETVYSNSTLVFPSQVASGMGFTAFNVVAAVTLLAFAFLSRRIAPLYGKKGVILLTGIFLVLSASMNFYSIYNPSMAYILGFLAVALGGVGIAIIILLWSELFGCLNPLRVGLYFSGGLIVGTVILWLFKGLSTPWLWASVCLIPIISLYFLNGTYRLIAKEERPHKSWGDFSFPWKPIVVVALYSFAYGMCGSVFSGYFGLHSGLGVVFAGLIVYIALTLHQNSFRYSMIPIIACPMIIISLIPFEIFLPIGGEISSFFALGSYTLILISIMIILSNLVYQHGVNALWLFGIERAVRLLSVEVGIFIGRFRSAGIESTLVDIAVITVIIALVISATALFLSEKQLSSPWGVILKKSPFEIDDSYVEKNRIAIKCNELAHLYKLTEREEEVLILLAQKKKPADIEKELFVANSTVKTHTKNIYRKLDVHSRNQLYKLLGIQED